MSDEGTAETGPGSVAEIDHAVRQTGLFQQRKEACRDGGGVDRWLEHDRVAADDCRGGHAGHDREREVPRGKHGANAKRHIAQGRLRSPGNWMGVVAFVRRMASRA